MVSIMVSISFTLTLTLSLFLMRIGACHELVQGVVRNTVVHLGTRHAAPTLQLGLGVGFGLGAGVEFGLGVRLRLKFGLRGLGG